MLVSIPFGFGETIGHEHDDIGLDSFLRSGKEGFERGRAIEGPDFQRTQVQNLAGGKRAAFSTRCVCLSASSKTNRKLFAAPGTREKP